MFKPVKFDDLQDSCWYAVVDGVNGKIKALVVGMEAAKKVKVGSDHIRCTDITSGLFGLKIEMSEGKMS